MSLLTQVLAAAADELERLDLRAKALLRESVPSSADELLPEYATELAIDTFGLSDEEVLAFVVSRHVSRQRFRPGDIQAALAPLLGLAPTVETVLEISHADSLALGDERLIYHFYIVRLPTLPGTYYLDSAQELLDKIKPSHTLGTVIESVNFLTDDPFSLTDRDLLGI